MLEALNADAIRRWSAATSAALDAHRREIDDLNVFPVPDRDTGTNLALTLHAAADALAAHETANVASALQAYARGAVLGARGNSGVIMSQLLRGIAEAAAGAVTCDAEMLRAGLIRGAEQAWTAVAEPVDGTILTVARAAASALPNGRATLVEVTGAAVRAADDALERTTEQLPALAGAGVVDAGGRGLVLVLEALARTVGADFEPARAAHAAPAAHSGMYADGGRGLGFEVQYLLQAPQPAVTALRDTLEALGESVAVVGTGDGLWNVHVHVADNDEDIGRAIEAGVALGRPSGISVTRLTDQFGAHPAGTAVVALTAGATLGQLFADEGVLVVHGAPHRSPMAQELIVTVRASAAAAAVILPNDSDLTATAEAAAQALRAEGVRVTVVPTRSPVQGLAAVAVHDPARRFEDDVVAMAEAAAATRYGEVAYAEQDSLTSAGICRAGDILGLIDGEVVEIGQSVTAVACALVDRLLGIGAELMTFLVGSDAPPGLGELVRRHALERAPLTEVTAYPSGERGQPLIIGAE